MDMAFTPQNLDAFAAMAWTWAVDFLPRLAVATLILVVGLVVARTVARLVGTLLARTGHIDETVRPVLAAVARYAIVILVVVAALGQLGVQTASLLAVLGAAGLAIGLALQGTLSNIAAGLMLLWLRPFKVGEAHDTKEASGTVVEVGLFATLLRAGDGVFHFVPNSDLWKTPIKNFSRNATRMIEIVVGIDYEDDIPTARSALIALASADKRVLEEPAPKAVVVKLDASSVNIALRCWVHTSDYGDALPSLTEGAKTAIEAAGLSLPYPQQVVSTRGAAAAEPDSKPGATTFAPTETS